MSRYPTTPETIIEKKNKIFQATRQLLARKEFHDLTIDDIAKKAGIAKGSIYLYFKSKDALHTALVQSLFDTLIPQVEQISKSDSSPTIMLRQVIDVQLKFFEDHMDVFIHFFRDRRESSTTQCLKERFHELVQRISKIIEMGIKKKEIRSFNSVKGALILIGMVRSCIIQRIHGYTKAPLSRDADEIWNFYINGAVKQ